LEKGLESKENDHIGHYPRTIHQSEHSPTGHGPQTIGRSITVFASNSYQISLSLNSVVGPTNHKVTQCTLSL